MLTSLLLRLGRAAGPKAVAEAAVPWLLWIAGSRASSPQCSAASLIMHLGRSELPRGGHSSRRGRARRENIQFQQEHREPATSPSLLSENRSSCHLGRSSNAASLLIGPASRKRHQRSPHRREPCSRAHRACAFGIGGCCSSGLPSRTPFRIG